MKNQWDEALAVMKKASGEEQANSELEKIKVAIVDESSKSATPVGELFKKSMALVLTIGVVIGIIQQITGINAVFFYAPMIFEQSGIGTDASFVQAILVGVINLVFTLLAIAFIDRLGRKPLLIGGLAGIVVSMFLLSYNFSEATYTLSQEAVESLPAEINRETIASLTGQTYDSDLAYKAAIAEALGEEAATYESNLISAAIKMNPILVLIGILGFVASFAISIGPVMWVLFSELFPNKVRGLAISFVGLINSGVSFLVQLIFPWELANLGSATTFLIYGIFGAIGLMFVLWKVPETKGKSLEELERLLVKD
jgi:MFS family permease